MTILAERPMTVTTARTDIDWTRKPLVTPTRERTYSTRQLWLITAAMTAPSLAGGVWMFLRMVT